MLSLSTIFPEDLQIFCCHLSSESINFLQAIEITSGKAFRLFSEHQKSSIIIIKFVFIKRKKKGISYDVYSYPHKKTRGSVIVNRRNLVKAHKKEKSNI